MSRHIPDAWRKLVADRALHLCEYCLVHEDDTAWTCPIDHIISLRHQGKHHPDNLAFTCIYCNRNKAADLGTILNGNRFFRFFNPRLDHWFDHFYLDNELILPKTEIGEATVKMLAFNHFERIIERRGLIEEGRFPHPNALRFIHA